MVITEGFFLVASLVTLIHFIAGVIFGEAYAPKGQSPYSIHLLSIAHPSLRNIGQPHCFLPSNIP